MQNAEDRDSVEVLRIDDEVVRANNHLAGAVYATDPVEPWILPQARYLGLDIVLQSLGRLGIVVRNVIDDRHEIGDRRGRPFKIVHGAFRRSAPVNRS